MGKILDSNIVNQLRKMDKALCTTIMKSSYESDLEIFETVQVYFGCGGCYGTQISCSGAEIR